MLESCPTCHVPRTQIRELRLEKAPLVSRADSFPYRNHEISTSLTEDFDRALRFGISDSHTFARCYAPSNVVLCLSRGRPATLCFELIDCVDRQMDGQSIFAVPVKGRRATKWRKGSYSNPESYL